MTVVFERGHPRSLSANRRLAALALLLAAAACVSGVDRNAALPTGVIGPRGGGGSSGGGGTYAGRYRLQTINDSVVPHLLANDSASGTGTIGDTTRVFTASFDSSLISLNTDTSVEQFDYLTIRDARTALHDSSFDRTISFGDTTFGTYSQSGTTVTVSVTDTVGGVHTISTTYTVVSGATLTGTVFYAIYNSDNALAAQGQALFVYDFTGAPLASFLRPAEPTASHSMLEIPGRQAGSHATAASVGRRVWRVPVIGAAGRAASIGRARIRP